MGARPNTHQTDQAIATLYKAGWHVRIIAALAGRNPAWIYRSLHRSGVERRGRWG